ncbi:MAG: Hsp20/alpha crystallin family protein [Bdellovibrionaceae bacterium]|nr:Hsp20/alpha crystallin family protein [Pseudobdellovibrionaceae bacterium]
MANELIPRRDSFMYPRSFLDMFSDFDRALESALSTGIGRPTSDWRQMSQLRPRMEVNENDKAVYLCVEMPGVRREDINIDITGRELTVSAERNAMQGEESSEEFRSYRKYQQTISIPEYVDEQRIESHYADGLLEILLPKAQEAISAKKIEVQSGKGGLLQRFFGQKSEAKEVTGASTEKRKH